MAVPFIYSPSTIIASSEMNTNLDFVDYTDIDNDKEIQWRDSGNVLSSWIKQTTTDHIAVHIGTALKSFYVEDSTNTIRFEVNTTNTYIGAIGGYEVRAYDSTNVDVASMLHNGSDAIFASNAGNMGFQTPTGIFNFSSGVDDQIRIFNAAGTAYGELDYDVSNFVMRSSSGDIVFQPNSTVSVFYSDIRPQANNTYWLGSAALNFVRVHTRSLASDTTVDCLNEFRMTGGSSAVVAAYNTGSSKRSYIQHNDSYGIFGTSANHMKLEVAANGDIILLTRMPRRAQSSTTYSDVFVQRGFFYITGGGTAFMTASVTFGRAYDNDNVTVQVTPIGFRNTADGTPDDEGWFTGGVFPSMPEAYAVTTTGFSFSCQAGSGTFSATRNYGFSWVAIGVGS